MRKRTFGIHVRVTEKEKELLTLNAERCRLSLSDYLRKLGLGREISPFPQKEIYQVYKLMNTLSDDIYWLSEDETRQRIETVKAKLLDIYLDERRVEEAKEERD